jgi:hypothetical protein
MDDEGKVCRICVEGMETTERVKWRCVELKEEKKSEKE